jgi:uncharacterized protein (TIGR03085 family)
MSPLSRTERGALCDTALSVGEDRPTLCGDWTVKDLVVHLLVREGSPTAVGIWLSPLAGLTEFVSGRTARADFDELVERLRNGPPRLSVFSAPKFEAVLNSLEFFVHHEDIRRAQPDWEPRALPESTEDTLWKATTVMGKRLVAGSEVGVDIEDSRTGDRRALKNGTGVVIRGLPSEVTMFVYGRKTHSQVTVDGEPEAVAQLYGANFSL